MGANGQHALRHGQVAIAQGAFHHRLGGQQRLQLPPERDPFQQRARHVQPRLAQAERRIHVKMRVDEGGRHQVPIGLDHHIGRGLDLRRHLYDRAIPAGDIDRITPIGQPRAPDQ